METKTSISNALMFTNLQVLAWINIEMKARVPALTLESASLTSCGSLLTNGGEVISESAAKRPS